jgi:hypothetical protein
MVTILEQLNHMRAWTLQDQSALTKEQLCRGFLQMIDDALEIAAQQLHQAELLSGACPECGGSVGHRRAPYPLA